MFGCGSSAECVLDSDCASLAQRCEAHACVPLGGPPVDLGSADLGIQDGAPTDGPRVDAGPPDAGPPTDYRGHFTAETSPGRYAVSADFMETPPTPPSLCTTHDEGPCSVTLCAAGTSTSIPHGAGSLMLTGGTADVSIAANADETYTTSVGGGPLFAPAAVLTFEASGSDTGVPAFSGMVTAPSAAMLTTPSITDATALTISRTDDLALAWTPSGPVGTIDARFFALGSAGEVAIARCRFPTTAFAGTVPAAAFADFPVGVTGSYSFDIEAETELALARHWNVTLTARSALATPSGISVGPANF